MNAIINSPTEINTKEGWTVFLAGPMKASPRGWRNRLVKTAGEMGIDGGTFLSPRFTTMHQPSNQVQWETQGLRMCDVALFWIPNKDPKAELGHRVYAETTKMELAKIIEECKFNLNHQKTRLQKRGNRQEVTGITVSEKTNVSRKFTKNLRSDIHRLNYVAEPTFHEVNVIRGKLNYLSMVKGKDDSTYRKLLIKLNIAFKDKHLYTIYEDIFYSAKRLHSYIITSQPEKAVNQNRGANYSVDKPELWAGNTTSPKTPYC